MECLRSITSLAHLSLPKRDHGLPSAQDRVRDLSKQFYSGCGLTRSSTAIEHSDTSGRCGFDSHRERQFRRAVEFGLSVKRVTASGFESRPSRKDGWVPNSFFVRRRFRAGPLHFGYRTGSSTAPEHPVQTGRCGSIPVRKHRSCPLSVPSFKSVFDGSLDWVIALDDVVAGSIPASGSSRRGSSVVEHVNSQFVSYPSVFSGP